jgi:hypothetical protein
VDGREDDKHAISHHTQLDKKLLFNMLHLAILNCYILLSVCGGKKNVTQTFLTPCLKEMVVHAGQEQWV